jgi:hypothetical protein
MTKFHFNIAMNRRNTNVAKRRAERIVLHTLLPANRKAALPCVPL